MNVSLFLNPGEAQKMWLHQAGGWDKMRLPITYEIEDFWNTADIYDLIC